MRVSEKKTLVEGIAKADKKDLEMFASWEFVEEDGSLSPFAPSL